MFLDQKCDDKYVYFPVIITKLGLLYHAIKSASIKSFKSVFNKRTNWYELRRTINDKIDWIPDKYNITQDEISVWRYLLRLFPNKNLGLSLIKSDYICYMM